MRPSILSFVLLTLCTWLPGQETPPPAPTLDRQQAASRLDEARVRLEGLPKSAVPDTPDALLRQAWERRVTLLEEALALFSRAEAQERAPAEIAARRQDYLERKSQHADLPAVEAVEAPTEAGLEELAAKVAAQRERIAALRAEEAGQAQHIDEIPALLAQARSRLQAALERSDTLNRDFEAAPDPGLKEVLQVRAESAVLDAEVARLLPPVLERDREIGKTLTPIAVEERGLAELRLERLEQEYELYRESLGKAIDRTGLHLEQELTRLESSLEAAQGPAERFVAGKKLETLRFQKNDGEHSKVLLALRADLEEQERRLTVEIDELKSLRNYLEKAGGGEQAGERIKFTMQRVKLRGQALKHTLRRDVAAELSSFRSRRFELEDQIFFLTEAWNQEVDSTARELNESEAKAFRKTAATLLGPYRMALLEERDGLTALIGVGQELQVALLERRTALDALETFIRSKVFWIRDAKPLGPALWSQVVSETAVVTSWARDLGSQGSTHFADSLTRPGTLTMLLLLLVVLPLGLYWARQRVRRFVTRMNDRTVDDDARIGGRLLAVGGGILSVALLPVFLFILSRSLGTDWVPGNLAPVLGGLLGHLAVFLLFWFLSRSFFAGRGTVQVQFGMDRDAAHNLHRALVILLLGYLSFFAVGSILSRPPFLLAAQPLEALPRLAYTLFLIVAVVAGIVLLQPRSAFTRNFSASLGDNFFGRRWPMFGGLVCLAGVGIAVLEITGYRYGAGVLARNLALSLVTLLVLVPLYKGTVVVGISRTRAARAKRLLRAGEAAQPTAGEATSAPAGPPAAAEPGTPEENQQHQIRRLIRALFLIGGVVLIASLWGIDSQVFRTLDQLQAYDIRDTGEINEFVSYGDLLRTVLIVLAAYLLLKYLPGLYEYGVFSRLDLDSGLKYAILTMSRYGIFTVGAITALSAIHLDLGRLGWLMAAMGVGLGFGLQEIVSNFVSGIILLVERPVRVGDVVTVGTVSGKVQRINIRATSVINFDRQEIIVPNRNLITKEVTNWTRGDTIIRLVVPIGVAYGSDIDQVTNTLLEIARQQPEILTDPSPQAFFLAHGESSLDFELRVFVPDPSTKIPLLHRLNRALNKSLTDQGIEIPFPQRDLHIRSSTVTRGGSLGAE